MSFHWKITMLLMGSDILTIKLVIIESDSIFFHCFPLSVSNRFDKLQQTF